MLQKMNSIAFEKIKENRNVFTEKFIFYWVRHISQSTFLIFPVSPVFLFSM